MRCLVLGLVLAALLCYVQGKSYEGFKVLRVVPKTERVLEILKKLDQTKYEVEFWKDPTIVGQPVDIMAEKDMAQAIEKLFAALAVNVEVMIEDVGQEIKSQATKKLGSPSQMNHDRYLTLDEINAWVDDIVSRHSDKAEIVTVGSSYEGRSIRALKITRAPAGSKAVWIDGGIHSREWVSPATMLYFIDQLLNKYDTDAEIKNLVDNLIWYVLPVFNVDGYIYTWTTDRLWRKTRSVNAGSSCRGCDPNRNWDYRWGEAGVSGNPCSETFPGPSPFSEIEVKSVVTEFLENIPDLTLYMAFHSYGQMYMLPYGFTTQRPPDYSELSSICSSAVSALRAVHGQTYRCESLINLVGPSSGSSVDYMYGVAGVKYSFGVELRDTGRYGFVLPPSQILPTAEENWAAVKVITNYILQQ